MRKMALTIGLLASLGAVHAAQAGVTGDVATATGSLTVGGGCTSSITLANPDAKVGTAEIAEGAIISNASLVNTCDGKAWVGYHTVDSKAQGVLEAADGNNANYAVTGEGYTWVQNGDKYVMVTNESVKGGQGNVFTVEMAGHGDFGLPKAGEKYTYTVEGGYWAD